MLIYIFRTSINFQKKKKIIQNVETNVAYATTGTAVEVSSVVFPYRSHEWARSGIHHPRRFRSINCQAHRLIV